MRIDRTWAVEPIEFVAECQGAVARSSTFGWIFDPIWVKVAEIDATK